LNGTTENIFACLGTDPCAPSPSGAAVPGPLPLLGAGAAFCWSRRLRKRIASPGITPPQA
jgi:MYXO-CTERM domain-containing protein